MRLCRRSNGSKRSTTAFPVVNHAYWKMPTARSGPSCIRYKNKIVVFGGEALDVCALDGWFDRHGDESPRLVNMFGIPETTVHVTGLALRAADVERGGSVIGRPLADLQAYILDGHGQPVPIGVSGELHIGGAGLARGGVPQPLQYELNIWLACGFVAVTFDPRIATYFC